MKRVTADSNVYISAWVFGGKPMQVLEMALEGQIELCISDAILSEALRILRDRFHRTEDDLQEAESVITSITTHVYPTQRLDVVPSEKDDNRVVECAAESGSEVISTGDNHFHEIDGFKGNPRDELRLFLGEFQSQPR